MKNLPYKQKTELRIKARFFYESYLYLMSNIERRWMNEEVGNRAVLGTLYLILFLMSNIERRWMNEEVGNRALLGTLYFLMSNSQLRLMNEEEGLKSQQWAVDRGLSTVNQQFIPTQWLPVAWRKCHTPLG
jgi:hypothetical protein